MKRKGKRITGGKSYKNILEIKKENTIKSSNGIIKKAVRESDKKLCAYMKR